MFEKRLSAASAARLATIAALALFVAVPATADAREVTRQTTKQRTDNGHVRKDTWSNAAGRTATREATVVNDRENRTRTRDVLWTGPNGQQATRQDVTRRTENGYTRDSVLTGPDGRQATRSAVVVNDKEAGTRTRSVIAQGPEGRQRTVEDQLQRTENGYTRSTTATNPNGAVVTRDVEASYDPETKTWSKEVTRERTPPAGNDD